ncbi:helix-turn-helix domain-containing protein [Enterococcus termitis]
MNIGETLKYLRENKNYTKKALAEGIVSVSFYSQVESGKSSITIELFFKLLKKLNVTFDEFFLISNGFNLPIETQLWNNFTTAYYEEDLNKLYQAKENIEFELQRQPDPEHSALKIYLLTANLAISRTKYETPKKFLLMNYSILCFL